MADNILKNEFMWEKKQEKKKLYKNWKLYAIALGITVIGAGTGLGVYYGVYGNHSEVTKIDLNTLNTSAIDGKENMNAEDALNAFLENNNNITDLKDNIETGTFKEPSYTTSGSLEINATTNGKYTGTITVSINAIGQTDLNNLTNLNTTLPEVFTNKQDAFNAFLDSNQEKYPDLKDNVEAGTFKEPNYTTSGSLEINATTNGKYTGTITVSINAIGQINLKDLILNTAPIDGKENMKAEDAFNAFLAHNTHITDLKDNVEAGTFTAPTLSRIGSLTITGKKDGKYSGSIKIGITFAIPSDESMVSKIFNIQYNQISMSSSLTLDGFKSELTNSIRNHLPLEYQKYFNPSLFSFIYINLNNKPLNSEDLKRGLILISFDFSYGSVKNPNGSINQTIDLL